MLICTFLVVTLVVAYDCIKRKSPIARLALFVADSKI